MIEKPSIEEQFQELLNYELGLLMQSNFNSDWMKRRLENVGKNSPKMQCWLYREAFAAILRKYHGSEAMAKQDTKQVEGKVLPEWRFVNIQLSDDEREAAKLNYADTDSLWDTLVITLKDGYKVTLSYEAETDSYCAALSGLHCGKPNERLTLTAWGDNEVDALAYVFYKHVTKLEFVWEQPGMKAKRLG